MNNEEFNKIKTSSGGPLASNNFLSTSSDPQVSLSFARRSRDKQGLTAVLFEINIDPRLSTALFASVDKISFFDNAGKEILFSMHTVFRIGQTTEIEQRLFRIELALTNNNDPQLATLTQHIRQATRGSTGLRRMASLMIEMGEFDKAEEIDTILIETTDGDYHDNAIETIKTNFNGIKIHDHIQPSMNDSYFKVDINGQKFIHKQSACWLLTDRNNHLSNDRLSRVIQTSRKENSNPFWAILFVRFSLVNKLEDSLNKT